MTATSKHRLVLFDLGGVGCHFSPARRAEALGRASGLPPDEVQRRLFDSGFDLDCDQGVYSLEAQCQQSCRLLGVSWTPRQLAELWAEALQPDEDVLALIDRLRPLASTGLLTNNGPLPELVVRELYPMVATRFDHLCFSYQACATKPDARAYLAPLERLGYAPGQCVFVDDNADNVLGARAVGIDAFRFVSPEALATQLAARGLLPGARIT
jgi:HAD superfamily hydrolase (TIGR01509 family)